MSISNKLSLILSLALIFSIGLGCSLLKSENSKENGGSAPANVDNTNSTANANNTAGSSNTNTNTTQKPTGGNSQTSVQFDKGKTSKSYKNTISKGNKQTYTLNAAAGQELSVKIISTSGKAGFEVFDPSGTNIMGSPMLELIDEPLKQSGNYKVVVTSEAASSEYSVQFDIKGGTTTPGTTPVPSSATKTVKFNKGSSSASYSNNLSSGSNHKYILGANAGQTMTVSVSGGAEFGIYSPDGTTVVKVTKSYSGPLPANGNYEIEVFGSPGPYTINFSVK